MLLWVIARANLVAMFVQALAAKLARTGVACAQIPLQIATTTFIRKAHEAGLQVHVWTLNRRHEIERALNLGESSRSPGAAPT